MDSADERLIRSVMPITVSTIKENGECTMFSCIPGEVSYCQERREYFIEIMNLDSSLMELHQLHRVLFHPPAKVIAVIQH